MTEAVLWAILCMVTISALLNMRQYVRELRKAAGTRHEEEVQRAMEEASVEETRRSRAMDEGIENLMTFQVKVGGKLTGGEPW